MWFRALRPGPIVACWYALTGRDSSKAKYCVKQYRLPWISFTGIILGMGSSNERRRYIVKSSLIGWGHTQDDPCFTMVSQQKIRIQIIRYNKNKNMYANEYMMRQLHSLTIGVSMYCYIHIIFNTCRANFILGNIKICFHFCVISQ